MPAAGHVLSKQEDWTRGREETYQRTPVVRQRRTQIGQKQLARTPVEQQHQPRARGNLFTHWARNRISVTTRASCGVFEGMYSVIRTSCRIRWRHRP
ncbi:hypothetical protein DPEC_G00184550 [Dallia pectoralis]|uniref:Uncharacterized protein n=1 Tax=Dallia pectoralis TaxID=75939 RepID=A0ACC2GAW5_DALPE|nr:hypothetical protein DPEC_G00184550 [Dallia pectoralis]